MKRYAVIFSPLALDDLKQTVEYYQKQQALGKRFATQLQLTLNTIKRNPSLPPRVMMISAALLFRNFHTSCNTTSMKLNSWLPS